MTHDVLPDNELKKFKEGYNIARRIAARKPAGGPAAHESIGELISRDIKRLTSRPSFDFEQQLIIVTGYQDDGISWACQQTAQAFRQTHGTWRVTPLVGRVEHDSLPEIVKEIGVKHARRICRRLELLPSRFSARTFAPIIAMAAAVVLSLVGALLTRLLGNPAPNQSPVALHSYEWSLLVISATLSVVVGYLINQVKVKSAPEIHSRLLSIFGDVDRQSAVYESLLREVTRTYLGLFMPRCVIVDDFAGLDPFTREAVRLALREPDIVSRGSLLWVVFETREAPLLGREVFENPTFAAVKPLCCDLELASEPERRELAKALGWPEARAVDHLFLKTLALGITENEKKEWERLWREFLRVDPAGRATAAEILQLIACNSLFYEFALSPNDYTSIFATGSDSLFLSLIREDRRPLKRAEVREALTLIQTALGPLCLQVDEGQEKVRIKREAYDIVKPPEESKQTRMHLFWLLYWSRRMPNKTPHVRLERMLLAHIARIKTLSQFIDSSSGAENMEEYLKVLNKVAADCLDMTLMGEAVQTTSKLLTALDVITEAPAADDLRLSRVWRGALIGCWRVYVVTRAESILKPLFILLADLAEKKGIEPLHDPAMDDALQYLGLLGIAEAKGRLALSSKEIMDKSDREIFDKVLTYLRAAWVELLYQFTQAFGAERLKECNISPYEPAAKELLESISWEDYDETKIRTQQEFRVLNHELINLLNYACARSGSCDSPLDLYINVMAFEGSSKAAADDAQPDAELETLLEKALQREALASCLDASLEVINLKQSRAQRQSYSDYNPASDNGYYFRSDIVPGPLAPELNDICQTVFVDTLKERLPFEVKERSPLSAALFEKIEGLYQRAALIWEYFGFEDLRDRALIHRTDFVLRFSDADPEESVTFEKLFSSMSNAIHVLSPTGLAANLQLAAFFAPITDLSTKHFVEVACRIWEQEPSLSLMAASADAAIDHVIRPSGPNVHRLASLIVGKLGDPDALAYFAGLSGGRVLISMLDYAIQVPSLLEDDALFVKAKALAERVLREDLLPQEWMRAGIKHTLAMQDIRRQVGRGSITDAARAVDEWSKNSLRGGGLSEVFSVLLDSQKYQGHDLRVKAFEYLTSQTRPFQSPYDLTLCVTLVEQFSADSKSRQAKSYLQKSTALLKDCAVNSTHLPSLELMVHAYGLLIKHDTAEQENHKEAYVRYWGIYESRTNIENFVEFIRNGHYFYLLQHHYMMLRSFLQEMYEGPVDSAALHDMEMIDAIAEFRANKEQILRIVHASNGKSSISKTFFVFGGKFFNDSEAYNRDLKEIQDLFNQASHSQLSGFFDVILNQEDIPESLRDILQQRRRVLLEADN
jgi:hypothetical protein